MILFYAKEIQNGLAVLEEDEAIHCTRVLRKRIGDVVNIVDGKGKIFQGIIQSLNKKRVEISLEKVLIEEQERSFGVNIAIAPTKNISRIEWFLEKSTEIGLESVYFVETEHSERRKIRLERLEKITLSAMKQSKHTFLPRLYDLQKLKTFLAGLPNFDQKFIAWCEEDTNQLLKNKARSNSDILILIGPEGGFSPKEVALCKDHGFEPISLGTSRLRTETAGLVACHTVNLVN